MEVEQSRWEPSGWRPERAGGLGAAAQLVLLFGSGAALCEEARLAEVRRRWPGALLFGCSTAGEIQDTEVRDDTLCATAVAFRGTGLRGARQRVESGSDSFEAGAALARQLPTEGLVHVLVLSDGLRVNGSALVRGLTSALPPQVTLSGGLSGDGARFQQTRVLLDGPAEEGLVAAVGLYSRRLQVACSSLGGWDPFGPEREITRSRGNVLYELDGRSALELYKEYLGPHAADLPSSGLLFPLSLRLPDGTGGLVRTILSVDEREQSLTFAGDVPEGAYARLMKANFERLIDGATGAAERCRSERGPAELALLISCVGRKLVLRQRIEEEVEGVRSVLGPGTPLAGFYSYGEISPFTPEARCELHNQTMTITTLREG
jgi:hypothetical protein